MNEPNDLPDENKLSERELEVLRFLAAGLTNREIALRLFVSPETIKWHNKQIFSKLDVANRTEAAGRASALGLLAGNGAGAQALEARPLRPSLPKLPSQLTSFVGRQAELVEIQRLLATARLVTLTGPGGAGKTRLALRVAESFAAPAARFPGGVIFVGLAAMTDPEQIAPGIARKLALMEEPGQSVMALLAHFFGSRPALLLLDNYEHLPAGAQIVTELLAAAPKLTILATSRERLRLSGEHEYPVPPLAQPNPDHLLPLAELAAIESVALFVQRARATQPGFRLDTTNAAAIAAICTRLDGLPLAIELAAARLRLFGPKELQARLDNSLELLKGGPRDAPARQRTLRATIDWSYRLLSAGEQQLFARLAVFVDGRTIAAVEAICGPGLEIDVLDGLEALLSKSLLVQQEGPAGEPRFYMLETLQEYAWERLAEAGEGAALRDRHLAYFLQLVEEMEPGYRRHGQARLLAETSAEKGNLRVAYDWALASGQVDSAARLVSAMLYFWYYYDSPVEGYRWYLRVLAEIDAVTPSRQPWLLFCVGELAWTNREPIHSRQLYQQAAAMARKRGDLRTEAWAKAALAGNFDGQESFADLWRSSEEALATLRALDDQPGLTFTLNLQGELARLAGNSALARQKYEESLRVARATGEHFREIMLLGNLSFVAYNEGDYAGSMELGRQALAQFCAIGVRQGIIFGLSLIAGPLVELGKPVMAARLLSASQALRAEIAAGDQPTNIGQVGGYIARTRAQLGENEFAAAWAAGEAMTLEEAVADAMAAAKDEPPGTR